MTQDIKELKRAKEIDKQTSQVCALQKLQFLLSLSLKDADTCVYEGTYEVVHKHILHNIMLYTFHLSNACVYKSSKSSTYKAKILFRGYSEMCKPQLQPLQIA